MASFLIYALDYASRLAFFDTPPLQYTLNEKVKRYGVLPSNRLAFAKLPPIRARPFAKCPPTQSCKPNITLASWFGTTLFMSVFWFCGKVIAETEIDHTSVRREVEIR